MDFTPAQTYTIPLPKRIYVVIMKSVRVQVHFVGTSILCAYPIRKLRDNLNSIRRRNMSFRSFFFSTPCLDRFARTRFTIRFRLLLICLACDYYRCFVPFVPTSFYDIHFFEHSFANLTKYVPAGLYLSECQTLHLHLHKTLKLLSTASPLSYLSCDIDFVK